jgi:hypothetical protein
MVACFGHEPLSLLPVATRERACSAPRSNADRERSHYRLHAPGSGSPLIFMGTCTAPPGRVLSNLLRCSLEDPNAAPIIGRPAAIFRYPGNAYRLSRQRSYAPATPVSPAHRRLPSPSRSRRRRKVSSFARRWRWRNCTKRRRIAEAHAVLAPVLDGFAATPEFPEIEQACGNVRLSVWSEFHRADLDPF